MKGRKGFSLLEVVLASLILGIVVMALVQMQSFMSKQTEATRGKTFASQKAMQMLEELRSLVAGSESTDVSVLDDFDDGSSYSPILTTDRYAASAASAMSGNTAVCQGWKYLRQISVVKLPEEAFARRVYVRVYRAKCPYDGKPAEKLTETMTVLKTIKSEYVPTQVMDVYVICLENVAGWWSSVPTMRNTFEDVLQDVQTRNPGLELRAHWITKLSYGRDPYYVPYINSSTRTDVAAMPWVYFYPGNTRQSDGTDYYFYSPGDIGGVVNVDGVVPNSDTYRLCDQVNHAVRWPDEEAIYNQYVASATAAGIAAPEPSLRMLLEKMNQGNADYKNILLINLHGELLPLPPIRNYSDAAKDPEDYPDYRVVTHADRLSYTSTDTVSLRVYPYMMNPDSYSDTLSLSTVTIYFPNDALTSSDISGVQKITGNGSETYQTLTIASGSTYYSLTNPTTTSTLLTLYDTPMRHAINGNYGLPSGRRLYGLEYIPCPVDASGTIGFSHNLAWSSTTMPKNTARWIINFAYPSANRTGVHAFETRIGTDTTTGTASNKPENMSRSYVWISTAVPATEEFQFMGDPRHCPYKDVKGMSKYNWYFALMDNSYYPDFGKTVAGWGSETNDIDVPRFFQLVRTALLKSGAVWSAMNGFSYYYYGLGGEFGSDMEPLPNALPFKKTPWSTTVANTEVYVDEILNYNGGSPNLVNSRVVARTDGNWYAKYWLGELYPDSDFSVWKSSGNLPTNAQLRPGATNYYRATHTTVGMDRVREFRLNSKGCSSFFNGRSASSSSQIFKHGSDSSYTGDLTTLGSAMASMFNFPLLSSITAPRPFTLAYTSDYPTEWSDTIYSNLRTTLAVPTVSTTTRIYYDSSYTSSSYDASSVVQVNYGANTAYVVVSGLGTQSNFGTAQMGKYVLISMLRAFLDAGQYSGQYKITQIPYAEITAPTVSDSFNNPTSINVAWAASWKRWDGQPYTEEYSSSYTDSAGFVYNLKYSADNGRTWKFCSDDTAAKAGVFDSAHSTTATADTWYVGSLAKGSYILRLEAYRSGINLHYSYDQLQLYIYR